MQPEEYQELMDSCQKYLIEENVKVTFNQILELLHVYF